MHPPPPPLPVEAVTGFSFLAFQIATVLAVRSPSVLLTLVSDMPGAFGVWARGGALGSLRPLQRSELPGRVEKPAGTVVCDK